jgi:hypothetical protein
MRCCPGDIACIYRVHGCDHPKLREACEAALGIPVRLVAADEDGMWTFEDVIVVRLGLIGLPFKIEAAHDSILMPLRDNDGEDEVLRLAGKPELEPYAHG